MAKTTALSFPNMFDVARNTVAVLKDDASVVNRVRLLILSDPTSHYNEPEFGVGLKQHLWKYNTPNIRALIEDKIKEQLLKFEPSVESQETQFDDRLLFTQEVADTPNNLNMTVGLRTKYKSEPTLDFVLGETSNGR